MNYNKNTFPADIGSLLISLPERAQNKKQSKEVHSMTKQDISEIKKLLTPKKCSITRICGCYVDGEKNKKTELKQAFLALPEEEMFKYFEILRKTLSGTPGKNLLTWISLWPAKKKAALRNFYSACGTAS